MFQAYPEDEHELIAAYAQQLANAPDAKNMEAMSSHSRNLVRELERKNREIMRDIHHLKRAHRNQRIMQMPPGEDPSIVTELEVCQIEWGSNYGYIFNLFVTSKTNSPIHEFKVLHKSQSLLKLLFNGALVLIY